MGKIHFSVDSALLRELGERLVGKPHIALAELVKNSYDADATRVVIRFDDNKIEVADNGHGMNFREFKHFWMRIGTPHKQSERLSRRFKRPVTGSKGVGRLAVQFLGKKLEIRTVSATKHDSELAAVVNWDEAVNAGELTSAVAEYSEGTRVSSFPSDKEHGTRITIKSLNQEWTEREFRDLAREIWWLQPPFRRNPQLTTDDQKTFRVVLKSPNEAEVAKFNEQMRASLDIWHARITGKLEQPRERAQRKRTGAATLVLEFADGRTVPMDYSVPDCVLHSAEFEIRIFHLQQRQPHGIRVEEARDYLKQFGGVHVYDAGFHLPYYGPSSDWLHIEIDHSHRLSKSQLLPEELQVAEGLNYLPTQARIYGVVHVDTSRERELARGEGDYLKIQVTRDRLVENQALENLRYLVRWALDFYAMQEAKNALERLEAVRDVEPVTAKFARVEDVLEKHRPEMPADLYSTLRHQVQEAVSASETESEVLARRSGLLGALATAGIAALAYEHEVRKQFKLLDDIADGLRQITPGDSAVQQTVRDYAHRLDEWLERARATRRLFSHLIDEENRERRERFKARRVIEEIRDQVRVLTRGIAITTTDVNEQLRLPKASLSEWAAIFQNVFLNAANALLDSKVKAVAVSSRSGGKKRSILVQDTGTGVDLNTADDLFKPFVRKLKISPERRALGVGGTGLGLTIVRMIANNVHCNVGFVEPDSGFRTAFELSWSEQE